MTREQYNEFLYIRHDVNEVAKANSTDAEFYISTSYCTELKQKATDLLTAIGYYPCRIGHPWWDTHKTMDEKIIFIHFESEEAWHECTLQHEREAFCKAINA